MSRILHLLCLHPEVQDRLRREVTEARAAHGDLLYDEISALPYLDAVCREALRVCVPLPNHPTHALDPHLTSFPDTHQSPLSLARTYLPPLDPLYRLTNRRTP